MSCYYTLFDRILLLLNPLFRLYLYRLKLSKYVSIVSIIQRSEESLLCVHIKRVDSSLRFEWQILLIINTYIY